jgi:hypothetical protein
MKAAVVGIALVVLPALSACSSERSETMLDLDAYQWKHRLLLIFAPSASHPALRNLQRELREKEAGVLDRDLIVFTAEGDSALRAADRSFPAESVRALRARFGVPIEDYTVVLIGKDGGEKMRGRAEIELEQVFRVIDAMPMRRREMAEREQL